MAGDRISVGGIEADIIIDTGNLDVTLAKVRAAMTKVDAAIGNLQDKFQEAGGDLAAFDDELEHLIITKQALLDVEGQLAVAVQAGTAAQKGAAIATGSAANATKHATESARGLSIQMKGASLAAISASRGFQDIAQAGPAAALNNLEFATSGLAQAFGATVPTAMAVGAAIQGVATVAYLLSENWDVLMDSFGVGIPNEALQGFQAITAELKRVNAALDEASKKSRLSLPEQIEFDRNKKRASSLGGVTAEEKAMAAGEGPNKKDRERGSAFSEAIKSQGGSKLVKEALLDEFNAQAEATGSLLGGDQIRKMLGDAGFDPASMNGGDIESVGTMFGANFDRNAMQSEADSGGKSIGDQIVEALSSQKFIDNGKGGMVTAGQMARSAIAAGTAGDKAIGQLVSDVLDKRLGNDDGLSAFSREFNSNSPEGKEDEKRIKENMGKRDKAKKQTEKDELEAADLADAELQESIKRIQETNAKNKKNRQKNEKDSRDAAPGVGTFAEASAMQALGGAISPTEAMKRIQDELMANGRTEKQAKAASEDIFDDAVKQVRSGIVDRAFGKQDETSRVSQVFDANSLAAQFQSSVGGSEDKKQTGYLEMLTKQLDALAKSGNLVKIK